MKRPFTLALRLRPRRALSTLEVVVSTMLIAVVSVGAMNCLGATVRSRTSTSTALKDQLRAHQLMTEILSKSYQDPGLLPLFGPELGELTGTRSAFDDVDDYSGWNESPLKSPNGAAILNGGGLRWRVQVELVQRSNPAVLSLIDQGVKRITVTVERSNQTAAELIALRSSGYATP